MKRLVPVLLALTPFGCGSDPDAAPMGSSSDVADASTLGPSGTASASGSADTAGPGSASDASSDDADGSGSDGGPPPAFDPNPLLVAIPPGTALDLGAYACDQPADGSGGCRAITDYSGLVYDPFSHRLLMFGGGHAGSYQSSLQGFDFATLAWDEVAASTLCADMVPANFDGEHAAWIDTGQPLARHVWDMMAVGESSAGRRLTILTSGGLSPESCATDPGDFGPITPRITTYDLDADTWSFSAVIPDEHWYYAASGEHDPVSSNSIVVGGEGLKIYDPVADTVTAIPDSGVVEGYSDNLVYFPPNDRFYYITRGMARVWEVTIDRDDMLASRVTEIPVGGDVPTTEETGWAYDPDHGRIGGGITAGVFYAFDPATAEFEAQEIAIDSSEGATLGSVVFHALAYDPIDGVYVFIGADTATGPAGRTWAYRPG